MAVALRTLRLADDLVVQQYELIIKPAQLRGLVPRVSWLAGYFFRISLGDIRIKRRLDILTEHDVRDVHRWSVASARRSAIGATASKLRLCHKPSLSFAHAVKVIEQRLSGRPSPEFRLHWQWVRQSLRTGVGGRFRPTPFSCRRQSGALHISAERARSRPLHCLSALLLCAYR